MPSKISFTFPDRGFWAPSSMPVSMPKAAWGESRPGSDLGMGGPKPRAEPGTVQLETQTLGQGMACIGSQTPYNEPYFQPRRMWGELCRRE